MIVIDASALRRSLTPVRNKLVKRARQTKSKFQPSLLH